jgi:hypothetical protein
VWQHCADPGYDAGNRTFLIIGRHHGHYVVGWR